MKSLTSQISKFELGTDAPPSVVNKGGLKRRPARWSVALISMATFGALSMPAMALPDPMTGGKDGGPISVLFVISQYASRPVVGIDSNLAARLTRQGYVFQIVGDKEPLTLDYLRDFSTVVMVGLDDYHSAGGAYYSPAGIQLLNTASNVTLIHQYAAEGGGVVVVPLMAESGSQVATTYGGALAPWKIELGWETIRDDANPVADWQNPSNKLEYSWTRNVTRHAVTEGVQSLAYPGCRMRWDDAYPTTPLLPGDASWQVVVRGESTSRGMRLGDASKWIEGDTGAAPALAAVRETEKGRIAMVGLGAYYLVTYPFAEKDDHGNRFVNIGEDTTGPMEGIAYLRGDGKTPSHWGPLFENMLRWTAETATKAGLGGKPRPWQSKLQKVEFPSRPVPAFAVIDWKSPVLPTTWAHHAPTPIGWGGDIFYDEIPDPLVKRPQQMNKVLIGAHSAYSDGKGSVSEWAKAAKAAGYKALVFTERFESFDPANWRRFLKDCAANSSSDFVCLHGIDIADTYGNRFLILGTWTFPSSGMLTPDGKALQQTSRLSLGFSGHISVLHRMGQNKSLPSELARHFHGVSVFTYADDKGRYGLVDDAFDAYQWQLFNASNPICLAVHELMDPGDVAAKGTIGFQVIVPAQDALEAVCYFRCGRAHFFENPQRYFITEGPIIDGWALLNKDIGMPNCNRDHFRAVVGASSPDPQVTIKEAVVYDRGQMVRRWTPNQPSFAELIDGEHGYQRHYLLSVTDSKDRRAISPHLRTVARGYYTRCSDRQNWFGAAGFYTGIWPSGRHSIRYIDPQFPAGAETEVFGGQHPLATVMSLPFAGNAMTYTDYTVKYRYPRAVDYGMDAWRIENVEPSKTYEAFARVGKWHDIPTGLGRQEGIFPSPLGYLTTVEAVIKSRLAVKPVAPCFPVVNRAPAGASYSYTQDGKPVTGVLDAKAAAFVDLPAGASVGDYLLLTPMRVAANGDIGWPAADTNKEIAAGTEWKTAYMYVPNTNNLWRDALGANGKTPWSIKLNQGKLASVLGMINLAAADYGVAGELKAGGDLKFLPVRISGLNPNWPAAVWSTKGQAYYMWSGLTKPGLLPGTTSGEPFLAHIGVLNDVGFAALDNTSDMRFYAGNTLTASDPALVLAYQWWTKSEAAIEVHNPTDKNISAQITSPQGIPGKYAVDTKVKVPSGSTVHVVLPAK